MFLKKHFFLKQFIKKYVFKRYDLKMFSNEKETEEMICSIYKKSNQYVFSVNSLNNRLAYI